MKNDGQQMSAIELKNQVKTNNQVKGNVMQNNKFEIQM